MQCGGTGPVNDADDHVKQLCSTLKGEAEGKAGKQFDEFSAISYKSQVVAGTNYFVKVHTGSEKFVHVRIYKPLPGQGDPEVHSLQHEKTREEDIAYF